MRSVCFLGAMLCSSFVFSQGNFHFEPSVSSQFVHHIDCKLEDKDKHRGLTMSPAIRLNFDISKRFTIVASAVTKNFIGEVLYPVEHVYGVTLKYKIGRFENLPDINFTVESGIGYNKNAASLEVPFYIGASVPVNSILTWNTRLSPPVFSLRSDETGDFHYASYGIDMGLAMRFSASPIPKYTRYGNPFILQ